MKNPLVILKKYFFHSVCKSLNPKVNSSLSSRNPLVISKKYFFPLRLQITQPKSHLIPLQGPRLVILAKGIWLHENLILRSTILRGHTKTILLKISDAFQFEIFKASSSDILYEY